MARLRTDPREIAYRKEYQKRYAQTEKEKTRKREYMRTYVPTEEQEKRHRQRQKMHVRSVRLEERSDYYNQNRARQAEYRVNFVEKTLLRRAQYASKVAGIKCDLVLDDIVIHSECPILHIPLIVRPGPRTDNTPSIDRIIPRLGYVKGNVQIISWRANRLKYNGTFDELIALGDWAKTQRLKEVLDGE